MEMIRNYLESMFANLPNTPEVQRAKAELYQMMEDKYTELIAEGKPENEAISIVISEFGNLEEIAETLGIKDVMSGFSNTERRQVTREEAWHFVNDSVRHRFFVGFGVMLFILSPIGPLLFSSIGLRTLVAVEALSAAVFFIMIAAGVAVIIYSSAVMGKWKFLKQFPCSIDYATADEIYQEKLRNRPVKALYLTIGIVLCIVCVVPVIIFESFAAGNLFLTGIAPAMLFLMVGVGVFLIIFSGAKESACGLLLGLNDNNTVSGNYESTVNRGEQYTSHVVSEIMSVYWQTVTCIYLSWSFLTFHWHKTWIIWVVAGLISFVIKKNYEVKRGAR